MQARRRVARLRDRGAAALTWDYLITVCDDASERCPWVPGSVERLHWSFPDPSRA